MTTPHDICSAMRNCKSLDHENVMTMLACFAAMIQKPSALSDKCTRIVVDMLDEITGQIEQDQIDQQAEAAQAGRDDSWMARQDLACEVAA